MRKNQLLERINQLAHPICVEYGVLLWDVTFEKEGSQYNLTIFIDRAEGVFVEDCERVSRAVDPLLDAPEFDGLPPYTLTVSSAGIQRRLSRDAHLAWAMGKAVELTFYKKGSMLIGTLRGWDEKTLTVETPEGLQEVERTKVSLVRIHYDF